MPGAFDDGGGGRGFKSHTMRQYGRVTQDTTLGSWVLRELVDRLLAQDSIVNKRVRV